MANASNNPPAVVLLEGETTNTRVWLVQGDEVLAEARTSVGARDTARDGSPHRLEAALNTLVAGVRREGNALPVPCRPKVVVAAGMLTSALGLREVDHVPAPAGVAELAARVERHSFAAVTDLPVLLVPGVRSGPLHCERESVGSTDVIRGEEIIALGLHLLGWLPAGGIVLSLGSHWKAIHIDREGRITGSVTSLGGELIDVVTSQTVLAGSLPRQWPEQFDSTWIDAGVHESQRSGLGRALFCVRLLEHRVASTPEERLAFLIGAAIGNVIDTLLARRSFRPGTRVLVPGHPALARAFAEQLRGTSVDALPVSDTQVAHAVRTGMLQVLAQSAFAPVRSRVRHGARSTTRVVPAVPPAAGVPVIRAAAGPANGNSIHPATGGAPSGGGAESPSTSRRRRSPTS
jgi:2-dehydro-3-deoxygalactonokinase